MIPHQMIQNLVPDHPDHLKRRARGHGIHNHIAMDTDAVFGVQDTVFILPGGVDDLGRELLALVFHGPVEGVFDGGVVVLDESALDEADG